MRIPHKSLPWSGLSHFRIRNATASITDQIRYEAVRMKIISGGETGADRAALDVALALGIPHGGSVPKGRWAEDGAISPQYDVIETATTDIKERTERNVLDSDGTLLVTQGPPTSGSALTRSFATQHGRPLLPINLDVISSDAAVTQIIDWLDYIQCRILNVAGPRSSEASGIYAATYTLLLRTFTDRNRQEQVSRRSADREVMFRTYEQFFSNFRHWDTIRWNVSVALLAFIATIMTVAFAIPTERSGTLWFVLLAVSVISTLWTYLLIRLIGYHNISLGKLEAVIKSSTNRQNSYDKLIEALPFSFQRWGLLRTASFLFTFLFAVVASGCVFVVCTWDRIDYPRRFGVQSKTNDDKDVLIQALRDRVASEQVLVDAALGRQPQEILQRGGTSDDKDALIQALRDRVTREQSLADAALSRQSQEGLQRGGADESRLTRGQWRLVQQSLASLHFYDGKVDGDPGNIHPERSKTRAAVRLWQRNIGEPATGYFTQGQLSKLTTTASTAQ